MTSVLTSMVWTKCCFLSAQTGSSSNEAIALSTIAAPCGRLRDEDEEAAVCSTALPVNVGADEAHAVDAGIDTVCSAPTSGFSEPIYTEVNRPRGRPATEATELVEIVI